LFLATASQLSGWEGRFVRSLGVAYVPFRILSSLLVSLTVTPVLSYWVASQKKSKQRLAGKSDMNQERDVFRFARREMDRDKVQIRFSLRKPRF